MIDAASTWPGWGRAVAWMKGSCEPVSIEKMQRGEDNIRTKKLMHQYQSFDEREQENVYAVLTLHAQ